jgi:hypothetical protein
MVSSFALTSILYNPTSTIDNHSAKSSTVRASCVCVTSCDQNSSPKSRGRRFGPDALRVADVNDDELCWSWDGKVVSGTGIRVSKGGGEWDDGAPAEIEEAAALKAESCRFMSGITVVDEEFKELDEGMNCRGP